MNLSVNLPARFDTDATRDWVQSVADALTTRHLTVPFANSLRVSEWVHATYPNPRTRISTDDGGTPIRMVERATNTVLLTIHCTSGI